MSRGQRRIGNALKKIGARCDAVARGVELGRQRQRPSAQEVAAYRALGLEELLWTGLARGQKIAARLEQLPLL